MALLVAALLVCALPQAARGSAPSAVTGSATKVTGTGATLNGIVNPEGLKTTYHFEYGATESYGVSVPVPSENVGSGLSDVKVSNTIIGLKENTTYHFRIDATNSEGTTDGKGSTFTTPRWGLEETVNPGGTFGSLLNGVSCASSTACVAVGEYHVNAISLNSLIESWNGTKWKDQSISNSDELRGVSCTSSEACTAVGRSTALRWNGTEWKKQAIVEPGEETVLSGVSCASSKECVGVGFSDTGGSTAPLGESWSGTRWIQQKVLVPIGAKETELEGVSCSSSTSCIAVGAYRNSSETLVTLAEGWNGTQWKIEETPNPSGARESRLASISCTSSTECTAVGRYLTSSSYAGLVERWNGTEWKEQTSKLINGLYSELFGVSCTSSTACVAVGRYDSVEGSATAAESWNGTEWQTQETPNPLGPPEGKLSDTFVGVSCTSATVCTGVGWYHYVVKTITEPMFTLAEGSG